MLLCDNQSTAVVLMPELSPARKKLRLVKAYVSRKPIWCSWQVTYACNYRCVFCDYWKEEVNYSAEARAREASLDEIRSASDKLGEIGSMIVSIGGGEPLLRRDLSEIVAAIARQHFPVLTTNGSLVTEQRARELWEAGLWGVSVSLDSSKDADHDSNRGVPGSAERARYALQVFSATRQHSCQRVNLICVLTERNLGEMEPLLRLASAHDATLTVQPYSSLKRAAQRTTTAVPIGEDATAQLLRLKRRYSNFLSSRFFLTNLDIFHRQHGVSDCRAGQAFFNIDNFLNVQKCVEFRAEPIGNLRELSPKDLLHRLRAERNRNACKACWYNCRGEVEALYTRGGLLERLIG